MHISVQILAGKFKMEFLPTISLTKAFPVAQICPNLHKIVAAGNDFMQVWTYLGYRECFCKTNCWQGNASFSGSRSERGGARRAPTKRVNFKWLTWLGLMPKN